MHKAMTLFLVIILMSCTKEQIKQQQTDPVFDWERIEHNIGELGWQQPTTVITYASSTYGNPAELRANIWNGSYFFRASKSIESFDTGKTWQEYVRPPLGEVWIYRDTIELGNGRIITLYQDNYFPTQYGEGETYVVLQLVENGSVLRAITHDSTRLGGSQVVDSNFYVSLSKAGQSNIDVLSDSLDFHYTLFDEPGVSSLTRTPNGFHALHWNSKNSTIEGKLLVKDDINSDTISFSMDNASTVHILPITEDGGWIIGEYEVQAYKASSLPISVHSFEESIEQNLILEHNEVYVRTASKIYKVANPITDPQVTLDFSSSVDKFKIEFISYTPEDDYMYLGGYGAELWRKKVKK